MTATDLLALREEALAGQAGQEYRHGLPVTFAGIDFRVPPQRLWPLKAMRHARLGEIDLALAVLVGAETADRLIDAGFVVDDLERMAAIGQPAEGGGPPSGRSSAS